MAFSSFLTNRKTITQLAKELGVSREHVQRYYLAIAVQTSDFSKDYPQLGGTTFTRVGLSEYQQWVLHRIRALVAAGWTKTHFFEDDDDITLIRDEVDDYLSKRKYEEEKQSQPLQQIVKLIES